MLITIAMSVAYAQTKQENSVKAATDALIQAMLKPNREALARLTCDKLSYGHSSGKIEDQEEFIHTLVSGASVFETIQRSDEQIDVTDYTAIVRHTLHAKTNDPGKGPSKIKLGIVLTWTKLNNQWKLLARQAYKLP